MSCHSSCTFCYQPCNSCSCRTSCTTCNSCSCSECVDVEDSCGCKITTSTNCVTLKGIDTNCIEGLVNGITLTDAVNLQNEYICNSIYNPSGHVYSTSSCDDNITVTTTQVNALHTNYEVCLSEDLVEQIEDNTAAVATLTTCTSGLVGEITTGTPLYLTVTNTGADTPCGRVYNINFNPSGNVTHDGILYNNTDSSGTSGGTGDKILKSFNHNYTNELISNKDEIRIRATGQIMGDGATHDSVKIELYDATSASVLYTETFGGFDKANKSSWLANCTLAKIGVTTGLFHIEFLASAKANGIRGNYTNASLLVVDADVTGIDYSNLTIRIVYEHDSTTGATDNFARQLMVEVRKYIG